MSIDMNREEVVLIREVPGLLPKKNGRKKHLASIYRWLSRGLVGVRLESVYIGGEQYTSKQALDRFFCAVTEAKRGSSRRKRTAGPSHKRALQQLRDAEI